MTEAGSGAIARRNRRALALAAVAIPLFIIGARLVPTGGALLRERRTAARAVVEELKQSQASIRAMPAARDSLVARRVRLAARDSAILEGASRAAAGARLAEIVADAAEQARTQLGTVQLEEIAESTDRQPFVPVRVHASVSGSLEGIARVFAALEKGPVLLAIRQLTIAPTEIATPRNRLENLRVELVVEGLARSGTERTDRPLPPTPEQQP